MSILPIAIAHSRFAQDSTLTILASTLTICFALGSLNVKRHSGSLLLTGLAVQCAALFVHPTTIFCVPFFLVPIGYWIRRHLPSKSRRTKFFSVTAGVTALLAIVFYFLIWPTVYEYSTHHVYLNKPWLRLALERITNGDAIAFTQNYGRLFTGVSVLQYIAAPRLNLFIYDAFTVLVGVVVIGAIIRVHRRKWTPADLALIVGWAISLLVFFLIAGSSALSPGEERYGLVLVMPGILVFARSVFEWTRVISKSRLLTLGIAAGAGALCTVSFYQNYFGELKTTGGRAHRTFITAEKDPKLMAVETIDSQPRSSQYVGIVAQEYWIYWSMRYFTYYRHDIVYERVLSRAETGIFAESFRSKSLYTVDFQGTPAESASAQWILERNATYETFPIKDKSGRHFISIRRVIPNSPQPRSLAEQPKKSR